MVTAFAAAIAALFWGQALTFTDPLLTRVAPLAARVLRFGTVTTPSGDRRPDGKTLFEIGSVTTADDLLTFARASLGEGDAKLVAACRASHAKRAGRMGLFWNRVTLSRSKSTAVWHNGGTLGSRAMLVIVPDKNIAVVALRGCGEVGREIDSLALTLADRLAQQASEPPPK